MLMSTDTTDASGQRLAPLTGSSGWPFGPVARVGCDNS
jgi:hypothetical protein